MTNRLFVGGLAWATDDARLLEAFEQYGEVVEAKVIADRETGRSRGFGFVTFAQADDAQAALELNDQELDGRAIRVDVAKERPRQDRGPGGRGGRPGRSGDRRY